MCFGEREEVTRGRMLKVFWHGFVSGPMGTGRAPGEASSSPNMKPPGQDLGNWWGAVFYRPSPESLPALIQIQRGCKVEERRQNQGPLIGVNGPIDGD